MFVDKKIEDDEDIKIVNVVDDEDGFEVGENTGLDKVIPADEQQEEAEVEEEAPRKSAKERRTPAERIAELTRLRHEAERERDLERQQRAELAKEVENLRKIRLQSDDVLISSREAEYKAAIEKAKRDYREAINNGDVDAQLEAQETLTRAQYRLEENERIKQNHAYRKQQAEETPPVQEAPPPRQVDNSLAVQWAEKNKSWFNKDPAMSGAAFGIDAALKSEGMDPASPEYYEELDRRMKEYFPSKFQARSRIPNTVAPVSRAPAGTSRAVPLTRAQRDMAVKLGVPLNEYAKYVKPEK